ncbi:hypothetical protein LJC26_06255 [Desulfovibrio sp. OttesenSCG-928-O18]|nr:hypothetical protein [Desulfovibrio sp. OttesenSCG-928-O18]
MRRSLSRFFILLSVICMTALCVSPSLASEAKDRYIKVVGVEGKVLTLDVDGRPVRIPLPEGYEVMREEEYPEAYRHAVAREKKIDSILLSLLVDAKEAQKKRSDTTNTHKVITLRISNIHIDERYNLNTYQNEKDEIKRMTDDGNKWANSELQKKNRSPFSVNPIFEDIKSICFLEIEDYVNQGNYRLGLTKSYILFEDIVITVVFQKNIQSTAEVDSLVKDTINYMKLIGR